MYDLAVGPYDLLFALCWDRDAPGSPTRLVQLVPEYGALLFPQAMCKTCLCLLACGRSAVLPAAQSSYEERPLLRRAACIGAGYIP